MNKELTWELKATHSRMARLAINDGVGERSTMAEAHVVAIRAPTGVQMTDPGVRMLSLWDPQAYSSKLRL